MKTLEQVEPRTIVNATNTPGDADSVFKIAQAGSYYLIGPVAGVSAKHGIEIQADDVTLDLNGFSLVGVAGSLDGIHIVNPQYNIDILNGVIRNWAGNGLYAWKIRNSAARRLRLLNNGGYGMWFGQDNLILPPTTTTGCSVTDCTAESNAGGGIYVGAGSTVRGCVSSLNTGIGFRVGASSTVVYCTASGNTAVGITAGGGSTVSHCATTNNKGTGLGVGIQVGQNCTVSYCSSMNNHSGIIGSSACHIFNNTCSHNTNAGNGTGISGTFLSRIEGNSVAGNDKGIQIENSVRCLIIKNTALNNTTDYDIGTDSFVGPIISTTGTITSTNPWANFLLQ